MQLVTQTVTLRRTLPLLSPGGILVRHELRLGLVHTIGRGGVPSSRVIISPASTYSSAAVVFWGRDGGGSGVSLHLVVLHGA